MPTNCYGVIDKQILKQNLIAAFALAKSFFPEKKRGAIFFPNICKDFHKIIVFLFIYTK